MISMPGLDEAITASTAQKLFELLDTLFEESAYTASTMGQQSMMGFESSLVSGENYSIVSFSRQECGASCYGSNNSILCLLEDDWWTYRKDFRVLDDKNHIPGACMGIYPTTDPDYDLLLFEEKIINHVLTTSFTKRYYLYYIPGRNLRLLDLTAKTVEIMDQGMMAFECENEEFKYLNSRGHLRC